MICTVFTTRMLALENTSARLVQNLPIIERFLGQGDRNRVNDIGTVFMRVDNGVDNGSPPRLLHGHRVSEGGQLGGQ